MSLSIPIKAYVTELQEKGFLPTKSFEKACLFFGRSYLDLQGYETQAFLTARSHYNSSQQLLILEFVPAGAISSHLYFSLLNELGLKHLVSVGTAGCFSTKYQAGDIVEVGHSYHAGGSFSGYEIAESISLKCFADLPSVVNLSTDDPFSEKGKTALVKDAKIETVDMEVSYLAGQCHKIKVKYNALFVISDVLKGSWQPGFEKVGPAMKKAQELAISLI